MEKKMIRKRKKILVWTGLLLLVLLLPSCAGGAAPAGEPVPAGEPAPQNKASFDDVLGRDWVLDEVKIGNSAVRIDRTKPGAANVYTLRFEAERLGGVGAPNRYFGPYTLGDDNALSIGTVASTLMAALFENEDLREHDYYGYLNKAYRWDLQNGKLELYTRSETGTEVVLIYH